MIRLVDIPRAAMADAGSAQISDAVARGPAT